MARDQPLWFGLAAFDGVPLALRNLTANKRRLARSIFGIAFAIVLMLIEFGFRNAFLESSLELIRHIDGDIVLVSSTKYRAGRKDAFSRRQLYLANGVEGVASVRPIYGDVTLWKNPQTQKNFTINVYGFDPDASPWLWPEIDAHREALKQPDTVLFDSRARSFLGRATDGTETELGRRRVRIVGTFPLGPDFLADGTLLTSDRNFLTVFARRPLSASELADVEFGVIKIAAGASVATVKAALRQALPTSVLSLTKAELIALETTFQTKTSSVGPIFDLGAVIGFIVGMLISYQVLYTDLSDQLPQYATLKAIGFGDGYLVLSVLKQAGLYGLAAVVPAWLVAGILFRAIGNMTLLPLQLTPGLLLFSAVLTLTMCLLSGFAAMRRVLDADPAEVF
jgi:putative ABC transport system permease protein